MTDIVGRGVIELEADPSRLRRAMIEATAEAKKSGAGVESAFGKQAAAGMKQAETQARSLRGTLSGMGGDLKKGILGGLGLGAGFGAALAIQKGMQMARDAIVGTINAAATLDDSMTKSLAIMGDVSDVMRTDMTNAAREVAKATTFSASQAADAYFYLASAGLDAAASLKAMPLVAKFAQAGNFDLALATDLLTDAQSALGLTIRDDVVKNMENMNKVSDVLVKANTLANATVQQFSESLTNKGAAALRLVNKEIEEGVAVLAAWADQGVKGAEAGTRLDIVLRDLANAAIKNEAEFAAFGISVFDAAGAVRPIADIIADMEAAFDGLSTKQIRAGLTTLGFQSKTVSATASLLGTSGAIRTYQSALEAAGGTTQTVADKQLESLKAQATLLDNALVDLSISAGQKLTPVLKDLAVAAREDLLPALEDLGATIEDIAFLRLGRLLGDEFDGVLPQIKEMGDRFGAAEDEAVALANTLTHHLLANVDEFGKAIDRAGRNERFLQALAIAFTNNRYQAELAARAGADLARSNELITLSEEEAAAAAEGLQKDLEALAGSGFKDVKESANETRKALREAFRTPDSMKALIKQEKELMAARRRAIRLKDEDAYAIAQVALAENRAQQAHAKGVRQEINDIRRKRRERREAAAAEREASKAARADFVKEQVALGKTTEQARKLWRQTQRDHGIDIPVDTAGIDRAIGKLDTLAAKMGIGSGSLASLIIGGGGGKSGFPADAGRRASGGPLVPGTAYLYGENGPEIGVATQPGYMLDSRKTMRLLAGQSGGGIGGSTYTFIISVNAGAFLGRPMDAERLASQLAPTLGRELQRIGAR